MDFKNTRPNNSGGYKITHYYDHCKIVTYPLIFPTCQLNQGFTYTGNRLSYISYNDRLIYSLGSAKPTGVFGSNQVRSKKGKGSISLNQEPLKEITRII